MNKYINFVLLIIGLGGWFSCSEDTMDEINENVNNPSSVSTKYLLTEAMTSTAFNVVGSDFAFYASIYMEHNAGVYGQMYNAEIRSGEPTSTSTYDNEWSNAYNVLYNLKQVITECSDGGSEEGNYYNKGMAQVLSALNLGILTDLFGNVPWSEALQPGVIYQPSLDAQSDIYNDIFAMLDSAIVNLNKESAYEYIGDQDVLYGGDASSIALWKKMAYGLKARYYMHLSYRYNVDSLYEKVIEFADKSFESSADQCQYDYDGDASYSPFYSFYNDRDYFGCSESLHEKLETRDDPRDDVFFEANPDSEDGELIFASNGEPSQIQGYYGISAISSSTAPTYLLSYHEIEFLKAEAYARLGQYDNARTALEAGIVAACEKSNIAISESDAENYYDNSIATIVSSDSNVLGEVMVQKYIAFYEEEAIEAYNDYRRLKAMGESDFITLQNPLNDDEFPLRYIYGSSDATTNSNISDLVGDGTYVYSEPVWWAGGSY